jgi:hypothetical protein
LANQGPLGDDILSLTLRLYVQDPDGVIVGTGVVAFNPTGIGQGDRVLVGALTDEGVGCSNVGRVLLNRPMDCQVAGHATDRCDALMAIRKRPTVSVGFEIGA